MTMASRDIANMHLFLDLKKKFPDLPDDTIRSYTSLYAEDQDKCINILLRESKNHYNPSQPFADFRLPDGRVSSRSDDLRNPKEYSTSESYKSPYQYPNMHVTNKIQAPSGRSTSHAGVVHLTGKSFDPNMPYTLESHSAPVMPESDKPFNYIYKQIPVSSHTSLFQAPSDKLDYNQMLFSTTKEHIIEPSTLQGTTNYLPAETEASKKHAVQLRIIPTFPFQQQHVFNSSVCTTTSHLSRPGRHTTSLNFQLQPQSSDQYPIEISTIPTNIGDTCNSRDFGSHVQVSVGSQGATFTALRLQHPNSNPYSKNVSQHLPTREESYECSSSQAQNSTHMLPDTKLQPNIGLNQSFRYPTQDRYPKQFPGKDARYDSVQSYQASADYFLAVKNHQIAQLELVLQELEKEKSICSKLKAEVRDMERELAQQSASRTSIFNVEELNKLREENRKLRIECNCLLMEVDMSNTGQIPLGVTDEDFYANIFTGPNGALTSVAAKDSPVDEQKLGITMKSNSVDDDDDERNRWKCKKCTFANHAALKNCEICEMPKSSGSFFDN